MITIGWRGFSVEVSTPLTMLPHGMRLDWGLWFCIPDPGSDDPWAFGIGMVLLDVAFAYDPHWDAGT